MQFQFLHEVVGHAMYVLRGKIEQLWESCKAYTHFGTDGEGGGKGALNKFV